MTEKENAIYEFEKMATWSDKYTAEELQAINYARKMLHFTPQPKIGHWVRVDETKLRCSECGVTHFIAQYPSGKIGWCPNCGAKMIEPQEREE